MVPMYIEILLECQCKFPKLKLGIYFDIYSVYIIYSCMYKHWCLYKIRTLYFFYSVQIYVHRYIYILLSMYIYTYKNPVFDMLYSPNIHKSKLAFAE